MKLYDGMGPNPHAARLALAEKGLAYERVHVDMMANENRSGDYVARVNPAGTIPALETDDGQCISEIGAIAEYLDDIAPERPLIGATPAERAQTRMWARRLDLDICHPLGIGFQAGRARKFFEGRKALPRVEAAEDFLAIGIARLDWLAEQMGDKQWICGDRFSWADIPLFAYMEFFEAKGKQDYPKVGWIEDWRQRVRARERYVA
jgi:glutathione S-transferase